VLVLAALEDMLRRVSTHTLPITEAIRDYLLKTTVREHPLLQKLREETARMPRAGMQISPEQGQLLGLLVELVGARRCLEVGVFTGYSSLATALAMPADGQLIACDVSAEWTQIAERYWAEAGVSHKISLRLAPALTTLDALIADGQSQKFDFAFVDADKGGYAAYYERCLELLRPGGLLAVDNVLWGGSVADPADTDADTQAIRALNAKAGADPRVTLSLVTIGDGLLLVRKR
jgi:predicted O-methyltransferase YrrM